MKRKMLCCALIAAALALGLAGCGKEEVVDTPKPMNPANPNGITPGEDMGVAAGGGSPGSSKEAPMAKDAPR